MSNSQTHVHVIYFAPALETISHSFSPEIKKQPMTVAQETSYSLIRSWEC